jgi:hypothetical protein
VLSQQIIWPKIVHFITNIEYIFIDALFIFVSQNFGYIQFSLPVLKIAMKSARLAFLYISLQVYLKNILKKPKTNKKF